jgi:peptidoglycan hydrolase CwlO-like protein
MERSTKRQVVEQNEALLAQKQSHEQLLKEMESKLAAQESAIHQLEVKIAF